MTPRPRPPSRSLEAGTHRLVRLCTRHWFLRGWLDPLHGFAEKRGYHGLVRDNAVRLLEAAHSHRLRNDLDMTTGALLYSVTIWLKREASPSALAMTLWR